jgi:hypothetical protein
MEKTATEALNERLKQVRCAIVCAGAAFGAIPNTIWQAVRAAEKHEQATVALKMAVERVQPMLTSEGFVKLEELARVAAQFGDASGFLSAVGAVLNSQIVCQCWWCRLKYFVRRCIGRFVMAHQGEA